MSKLDCAIARNEKTGVLKLTLAGSLDIFSYMDFKKRLEQAVLPGKPDKVLIDLKGVNYIASSGWAVLTNAAKQQRREGGILAIYGLCEEVKSVYDTMGIAPLLASFADEAKALESVGSN